MYKLIYKTGHTDEKETHSTMLLRRIIKFIPIPLKKTTHSLSDRERKKGKKRERERDLCVQSVQELQKITENEGKKK